MTVSNENKHLANAFTPRWGERRFFRAWMTCLAVK
jgi:hypothetical protein